jgi:hypothetical protein
MLLDKYTKQSPIIGVAGLGGGINSYIFLSSGGGPFVISRSLRFNTADNAHLSRTVSSASNRKTWTWSGWVKRSEISSSANLFAAYGGSVTEDNFLQMYLSNADIIRVISGSGGGTSRFDSTAVFRDVSAWYHFVFACDTTQSTAANRLKVYVNGTSVEKGAGTDFPQNTDTAINNNIAHYHATYNGTSEKFGGYLADVHLVDGQALAPTSFGEFDTSGVWQPKKFSGSHGTNGFHLDFKDNSSNAALGYDAAGSNNWTVNNITAIGGASTNGIAFDGNDKVTFPGMALGTGDLTFESFFKLDSGTSGFRRILSRTDGGSGNDMIIRVHNNGYMQWYFDSQEHTGSTTVTAGVWHHSAIVRSGTTVSYYYDGTRIGTDTSSADMTLNAVILAWGYGSEYYTGQIYGARITKQALYTGASYTVPTSAITTTSQGASSSNVVHLSATTSTTTTNSGTTGNGTNSGDPSAISGAYPFGGSESTDSLIDSPSQSVADETDTGVGGQITGNYATMSAVGKTKSEYFTEDGNLTCGNSSVPSGSSGSRGYVPSTIGFKTGKWYCECVTTRASDGDIDFGIGIFSQDASGYYQNNGTTYNCRPDAKLCSPGGLVQSYGTIWADGDIIGIAVDLDSGTKTIQWFKNGTATGSAVTISTDHEFFFGYGSDGGGGGRTYKATWNFGQRAFAHTAPSGYKCLTVENLATPTIADGSKYFDTKLYAGNGGTQSITMDNSALSPDFVWIKCRNDAFEHQLFDSVRGALKSLRSDNTSAEATVASSLTSFNSNGFSLGASQPVNNTKNYAGWAWDAGSSTVTNNDGSIASQVRANQTAGFSICTYSGSGSNGTWGHGLLTAPDLVIVKSRSHTQNWAVQHSALGPTYYAYLQSTNAFSTSSGTPFWNNTAPTNTTVSVGTDNDTNSSGKTYVAYCFSTIAGYSAMGKYTGNGSTDGTFVHTGFKVAFLLTKRTDSAENWEIRDSKRNPFNRTNSTLFPHTSGAEDNGSVDFDFLSNGFKLRNTNGSTNASGGTYMYYAVAENPFQSARAR